MTASRFDGRAAETKPLGGAETAFVALAEALAQRGHDVEVRNRCDEAVAFKGVRWAAARRAICPRPAIFISESARTG